MNKKKFSFFRNLPLSFLSTFAIGGTAKKVIKASGQEELCNALNFLKRKEFSFKVFAGGSNIVFPDRGISQYLIQISDGKYYFKGNNLYADAGVKLIDIINYSIELGHSGLEKLSGIPGSIGGAVVGNAGAYGDSIASSVFQVKIWQKGKVFVVDNAFCRFAYRDSIFKHKEAVILEVILKLKKAKSDDLYKISQEILKQRLEKYHPSLCCPGSFFKNLPVESVPADFLNKFDKSKIKGGKIPTGYLLETVGALGTRVGGIQIADYHGNLFINADNGTAADVKKLAGILKKRVYKKYGIRLEEEIRYF